MMLVISTLLVSASIASSPTRSTIADDEYRSYGFARHQRLAATPAFSCVGALIGDEPSLRHDIAASAVWIGKNYVLTCAHCACNEDGALSSASRFRVRFTAEGRTRDFRGRRWFVVQGWREAAAKKDGGSWFQAAGDLAVLELESTPEVSGMVPAVLDSQGVSKGDVVCMVGFGVRGTNATGADERRFGRGALDANPRPLAFRQTVAELWNGSVVAKSYFDAASKLELQGQPSAGDSGGAVFIERAGRWTLTGIITGSQTMETTTLGSQAFSRAKGSFISLSSYRGQLSTGLSGDWAPFVSRAP